MIWRDCQKNNETIMNDAKKFGLWFYKNVFIRYLQFRYRTTLMTLARLTLLVLAKEIVIPTIYWILVIITAIWPNNSFYEVLENIKKVCVPSTSEIVIACLAVSVLLIVAIYEYRKEKKKVDILIDVYIPYTDRILDLLNIGFYHEWTYHVAVAGNTQIGERILDDMPNLVNFLKSRIQHLGFERLDELYASLALVVNDIYSIYVKYGDFSRKNEMVPIKRFYKMTDAPYNPNYDKDLELYNDIVCLVSDLIFEQTRILNLILKKIREAQPNYEVLTGILHVDDIMEHGLYTSEEEDIVSYSDIYTFMVERKNRSYHLGEGIVKL